MGQEKEEAGELSDCNAGKKGGREERLVGVP